MSSSPSLASQPPATLQTGGETDLLHSGSSHQHTCMKNTAMAATALVLLVLIGIGLTGILHSNSVIGLPHALNWIAPIGTIGQGVMLGVGGVGIAALIALAIKACSSKEKTAPADKLFDNTLGDSNDTNNGGQPTVSDAKTVSQHETASSVVPTTHNKQRSFFTQTVRALVSSVFKNKKSTHPSFIKHFVGYSLEGIPAFAKALQPGQYMVTLFKTNKLDLIVYWCNKHKMPDARPLYSSRIPLNSHSSILEDMEKVRDDMKKDGYEEFAFVPEASKESDPNDDISHNFKYKELSPEELQDTHKICQKLSVGLYALCYKGQTPQQSYILLKLKS